MTATTTTSTVCASSSNCPVITPEHVSEWASLGSSQGSYLKKAPMSEEELNVAKECKKKRKELKKKLWKEINDPKTWSEKAIECELDRLVKGEEVKIPEYLLNPNHEDNIIDHREEGGPLLKYLWTNPVTDKYRLQGQTLYLGGEVGSDGNIYCIPGHAGRVLKIDTTTDTIECIGPELFSNGRLYKWLRGIVYKDIIFGIPCHANEILKIQIQPTLQITKLAIPYEQFFPDNPEKAKAEKEMIWKYHGGAISPIDGCIYAIPQRASRVLKINPVTEQIELVGPEFPGKCKWYGGIIGKKDGAIYGIPQNAKGVLRITPTSITEHGDFGTNNHKWHGGAAASNTGVIVSVPANADTVLCVVPDNPAPQLIELSGKDTLVPANGRHRTDGKYKYLGAMCDSHGDHVYLFPCSNEYVLEVDTVRMKCNNIGPNLRDAQLELIHQNKWQNGLTCIQDQCVYGIPLSGHTLLRIDCSNNSRRNKNTEDDDTSIPSPQVTTWKLPVAKISCRDKFEGGVMTSSGVMYTVPNNHKGVLRIEPANLSSSK